MFDIKENLKKLPDKPGVYIYKDRLGQVIYIGKALSLKNRVRQYFQSLSGQAPKVRALVGNIDEFEYIITNTEMEALILENNLIKKYMPRYNVLLRDDKTFPYIKVTMNEPYPRVVKTRRVLHDGCRYFGPYTDVGAVNQIIDLLNHIYPLKKCSTTRFPSSFRPCLNYHIGQCVGICTTSFDAGQYAVMIEEVTEFLQGKNKRILAFLGSKMDEEAQALNFEKAAEYRDYINAVNAIGEKQKVVLNTESDIDVVLTIRTDAGNSEAGGDVSGEPGAAHGILFFIRQGKLSGRENYQLQAAPDDSTADITGAFIKQYYSEMTFIPKEILVEEELPEKLLMEEWLSQLKGSAVHLIIPRRGDKKALLEMAQKNVAEMSKSLDERAQNQKDKMNAITDALTAFITGSAEAEAPPKPIRRIEAYDISNTSGVDSVGVMVVFEDGRPKRKDYRRFKIKTIEGPNDYGSLQEVTYRRFKRAAEGDPGFATLPDLLLIDGGENQVSVVRQVLAAMNIDIPVAGMVKDDHHRTRGLVYRQELVLKEHPVLFKYIATVQEEVHRFAVGYHRDLRNKTVQKSMLDDIPGIGEKRRNALLTQFGSIEKILSATVTELCSVPGMNKSVAEKIKHLKSKQ
jgi:excinuclease ABC subunit C